MPRNLRLLTISKLRYVLQCFFVFKRNTIWITNRSNQFIRIERTIPTMLKKSFTRIWPKINCFEHGNTTNVSFVKNDARAFPDFEAMSSFTQMLSSSSVRCVSRSSPSWNIWKLIWRHTTKTGSSLVTFVRRILQLNRASGDIWEYIRVSGFFCCPSLRLLTSSAPFKGEKPYQCEVCDRYFSESSTRRKHRLTHFPEEQKQLTMFSCEICGKVIKSRDSFKQHMEVHSGAKNFECPICNKSFARKSTLRVHIVTHTGKPKDRPTDLICPLCSKGFHHRSSLWRHRKRSCWKPAFKCEECVKIFKQKVIEIQGGCHIIWSLLSR